MRHVKLLPILITIVLTAVPAAFAAVGCTLNDPDRDIKRIFPQATNYKTDFITIEERGGEALAGRIEERLGDKLDDTFETLDVPYAFYTVLHKKDVIGYVHGVNQRGTYGGMQLILATDLDGTIIDFYYQKISSPEAKVFRDEAFTSQFEHMTLTDFESGALTDIQDPSSQSAEDFSYTLRGLKKNMILLHTLKRNGE